jgi:hypothetical protein
MFCAKCGTQLEEGVKFCPKCGAPVAPPAEVAPSGATPPATTAPAATPQAVTRTSGFAIASLVLGIVGILINPLAILAIIFGGIGMSQTGKDPNLKGKGMAIAGLVLGIIMVAFWIIFIVWVGSAFWLLTT